MTVSEKGIDAMIVCGRLGLASLFLLGGINKLLNHNDVLDQIGQAGLPIPVLLLPLVILLELGGGLCVAIGRQLSALSAVALAGFTLVTNIVFHDFWRMEGAIAQLELALFFKNISICGALILFAGWKLQSRPA